MNNATGSNLRFQITLIVCQCFYLTFYAVTLYLLHSAANLLRTQLESVSQMKSNRKMAFLHFLLVFTLLLSTVVTIFIQAGILIHSYTAGRSQSWTYE